MVTIKDIARESGYSVSTVSRVLNHRSDVSPDAKQKIEEIVEKYHFVPNNNAKHLKQNATQTIAVLTKGTSNTLFANILEEIQRIMEKSSYSVVVSYLDEEANEVEQAVQILKERKPMGILFLGGNPDFFKEGFSKIDIPCVLVTTCVPFLQFPNLSSVGIDDVAAAKCAVDALTEAGHEKIGIIGGDIHNSYTSQLRYQGCRQSFLEHHHTFEEAYYSKARFSFEDAYRATKRLMKQSPDLTAIFAMSDVMAIGAIRALIDLNYKVPGDLSVIGFDGTALAEYYNPKLATIKQQYKTLAMRSVELLFGQLELKRSPVHEMVPFEFVSGESIRNI